MILENVQKECGWKAHSCHLARIYHLCIECHLMDQEAHRLNITAQNEQGVGYDYEAYNINRKL
jgi:hypothetical protein